MAKPYIARHTTFTKRAKYADRFAAMDLPLVMAQWWKCEVCQAQHHASVEPVCAKGIPSHDLVMSWLGR